MTSARRPTRRSVLAAGALALPALAACGAVIGGGPGPLRDPVRRESLGTERTLIAVYEQALAAAPALAPTLEPFLAQHRAHEQALAEGLAEADQVTARQTPAPAGEQGDAQAAGLAAVLAAERTTMLAHAGACARTDEGPLASLLSLISASEAQHVAVLGPLAAAPGQGSP